MDATLHIKQFPDATHRKLRVCAALRGTTIKDTIIEAIEFFADAKLGADVIANAMSAGNVGDGKD
jgi:hypothetical protein